MAFQNYYYSGQGSLLLATRSALGKPQGLVRVGNVPELSFDIATTNFEHKESESGDRLLDLTLNTEKKATFTFTLENLSLDNLALGLYGTKAEVTGASVVSEEHILTVDEYAGMAYPDISAVTVSAKDGTTAAAWVADTVTALGAYVTPTAPNGHYYKATARTGDFKTDATTQPTWPTNGGTVVDDAVTWTDMGTIVRSATTDYEITAKFGMITPRKALSVVSSVATGIDSGRTHLVSYTYATSNRVDVFTEPAPERWMRFEGLNTVDSSRVIIDLFKAQFDPLTGYNLLNATDLAQAEFKGTILRDSLQSGGDEVSKYFRQWNVSAT